MKHERAPGAGASYKCVKGTAKSGEIVISIYSDHTSMGNKGNLRLGLERFWTVQSGGAHSKLTTEFAYCTI